MAQLSLSFEILLEMVNMEFRISRIKR